MECTQLLVESRASVKRLRAIHVFLGTSQRASLGGGDGENDGRRYSYNALLVQL